MHQSSGSLVDGPRAAPLLARRLPRASARLLVQVPDRLPVVLGCLTLSALGATIAGQFRPVVVLTAWLVLVVATWRLVPAAPREQTSVRPVLALLALVGGWTAWGVAESGEYLVVNRDPGFLTLKAWWLVSHSSARIPVGSALQAAVGGASAETDAFNVHGDALLAQGNNAMPAVLATVGWAGGPAAVLWANVLVGAVALVAVYAVARRLVGPWWAVAVSSVVAFTLPMLAFTRSAYTEPLMMALTFGGLALLLGALRRPSAGAFALAGAMVGAAAAARIDGAIVVDGAVLGLICVVLTTAGDRERWQAARRAALAAVVMVAIASLGLLDVALLSPTYFHDLRTELFELLAATSLVLLVGVVLLASRLRDRVPAWLSAHRRAVMLTGQVLVVAVALFLATRPWWMTAHGTEPGSGVAGSNVGLQAAEGLPADPTRTYDEDSLTWLAWYLGWPALAAAVVGAVLLVRRIATRRDAGAAVVACMAATGSLLYLVKPSVTPDQIWAVRRLLPVALPSAALLAVACLAALWARRGWRWRAPAAALAAAMVVVPVVTWFPLAGHGELDGQLQLAEGTCDAIDRAGVDRVVWVKSAPWKYLATLRVVCDVDVVEFVDPPSPAQLAQVAAAWGDEPVLVMAQDPTDLELPEETEPLVPQVTSVEWGRRLSGPPRSTVTRQQAVWGGLLGEGGTLTPVTADDVADAVR